MHHVVVVVPINADIDKAQYIAQQHGYDGKQRGERRRMGYFQLKHHNGDDDRQHSIAECFQAACSYDETPVPVFFRRASPLAILMSGIGMRRTRLSTVRASGRERGGWLV